MGDHETKDVMLMEEDEAQEKSAFCTLRDSKMAVEDLVAQILSTKREGKPKTELRELATQMFLHFVTLRQANRSILLEEDRVKLETEQAKAPVDLATLQLHGLMYEKSQYIKAMKSCKEFNSKYPDIELVPEEEFLNNAPEWINFPVLSSDRAHDLMLKRLNYELYQRKELCELQKKLEERKKKLMETIANRKKFLSSLPSHLKSLKKVAFSVQNQLGTLHTEKLKRHWSAELLPSPLYVVYSQFMAQKEAFGENIDVEITGSFKDALTFSNQQATKDMDLSSNVEKSKLDGEAPDEEDDAQRKRRRLKNFPEKATLDQDGVYQLHPLKVILHVYDDGTPILKPEKLVSLKFEYLLKLNSVCVGVDGTHDDADSNVLYNLFPGDTGLELPHQSAKLIVGGTLAFDESRTSRPYKWAQHLAGIDFLPELPPLLTVSETSDNEAPKTDAVISGLSLYRKQNHVQTIVQRIRARKKPQITHE